MRVNTSTARYAKMIEGEQADNSELVESLRRLAQRQRGSTASPTTFK